MNDIMCVITYEDVVRIFIAMFLFLSFTFALIPYIFTLYDFFVLKRCEVVFKMSKRQYKELQSYVCEHGCDRDSFISRCVDDIIYFERNRRDKIMESSDYCFDDSDEQNN